MKQTKITTFLDKHKKKAPTVGMVIYKHTSNPEQNSLPSLDWERLKRAEKILTGTEKKEENRTNPKETLLGIVELWKTAKQTLRSTTEAPEGSLQKKAATLVQTLEKVQKSHFRSLQLPLRIRGENQLKAAKYNGFNPETQELRVALTQLKTSLETAEKTGRITLSIPTPNPLHREELLALVESQKTKPASLVFQNELLQRPETKRIWSGDYTSMATFKAQKYQTSPQQEILTLAKLFTGPKVPLTKKIKIETCQPTSPTLQRNGELVTPHSCQQVAESIKNKNWIPPQTYKAHVPEFVSPNGQINPSSPQESVEVTIAFPEILKAIDDNRELEQKLATDPFASKTTKKLYRENPGEGLLTDGPLKLHTSELYGCNGRQFLQALPNICSALFSDLHNSSLRWFDKTKEKAQKIELILNKLQEKSDLLTPQCNLYIKSPPSGQSLLELAQNPRRQKTRQEQFLVDLLFSNKALLEFPAEEDKPTPPPTPLGLFAPELQEELNILQTPNKPTEEEIQRFLQEYALIALTLTQTPKAITELGPNPARALSTPSETSLTHELEAKYKPQPHTSHLTKASATLPEGDMSFRSESVIQLAGPEWRENLVQREIDLELSDNPPRDEILQNFGIQNLTEKRKTIIENLYLQNLDNHEPTLTLKAPSYTTMLQEEFQKDKQIREDEEFVSKNDRLPIESEDGTRAYADEFELEKWILDNTITDLQLPNQAYLLQRMTRYSGPLRNPLSSDEKYDPSISLAQPKQTKKVKKEDFFAPGVREAIEKDSNEENRRCLRTFDRLIENWQTAHQTYSPLEYQIQNWIQKLRQDRENHNLKIQNPQELRDLSSQLLQTIGSSLKKGEKTPDWMQTPHMGSSIPLQLLCGVPQRDTLSLLKQDPQKLWDMVVRWSNAAQAHHNPPAYQKEESVEKLCQAPLSELKLHAVELELQEKPDFLREYLEENQIEEPLLPAPYDTLKDCLLPLNNCPDTINLFGEETPLQEIITHFAQQNQPLAQPTPESLQAAPLKPLKEFLAQLKLLHAETLQADRPSQQPATVNLTLAEGENAEELQEILGEDYNQELQNRLSLAEVILLHNPPEMTIQTESDTLTFVRGTANSWHPKNDNPENPQQPLIQKTLEETIKLLKTSSPEIEKIQETAQIKRVLKNLPHLLSALQKTPNALKKAHKDTLEPLELLCKQTLKAQETAQKGLKNLNDWIQPEQSYEDGNWKDKTQTAEILDAIRDQQDPEAALQAVSQLAESSGWSPKKEDSPSLQSLSQQLFSKEKIQAYSRQLLETGRIPTGLQIKKELQKEIDALESRVGNEILRGWETTLQTLTNTIELGLQPETERFFQGNHPSLKIARDRELKAYIAPQVHKALKKNPLLVPPSKQTPAVKVDGETIQTNKLWVKGWLSKPNTQERISKRLHLALWLKTANPHPKQVENNSDQIKTNLAFLSFCRHHSLFHVFEAIEKGGLDTSSTQTLNSALKNFTQNLTDIAVPLNAPLPTKLLAAETLHLLCPKDPKTNPDTHFKWVSELQNTESLSGPNPHTFKIVSPDQPHQASAMRENYGKNHMNSTKPGQKGWLGNPYRWANTSKEESSLSAEQCLEKFEADFHKRVSQDPAFRTALLDLRGKAVAYYKPNDKKSHIRLVQNWLEKEAQKLQNHQKEETNQQVVINETLKNKHPLRNPFQESGVSYQESPQELLAGAQKAVGILVKPILYQKKDKKTHQKVNPFSNSNLLQNAP